MAESDERLTPAPVLGGIDRRVGGVRIVEQVDLALVSVAVPQGGEERLRAALENAFALGFPDPRVSTAAGQMRAIRTAPDQLLLAFPHQSPDAEAHIRTSLQGTGYVTDQTGAFVALELSGSATLAALERMCTLDAARMTAGGAARTAIDHLATILVRLGDDRFLLLSASSSAASFLQSVETTCRNAGS